MSSAPDFPTNNNPSIVSDGYDHAQSAPPPEIEGRKNTSELGLADNWSEAKPAPDREGDPSGANLSYQTTSGKSAPGYTDICPKNPSVVDEESAKTTSGKSAPGYTGIGQKYTSVIDEESANTTSGKSAPGYTGIGPKNSSEIDEESANTTPVNPQDVGRRKIREVNLTEYYVKKK